MCFPFFKKLRRSKHGAQTTVATPTQNLPKLQTALSELPADIRGHLEYNPAEKRLSSSAATDVMRGEWTPSNGEPPVQVALKVWKVKAGDDDNDGYQEALRRMVREVQAWRNLEHPHIMRLEGWKQNGPFGQPCIITKYCQARDLPTHLLNHPDLSNKKRLQLLRQIGDAISYLHALSPSLVHGNISAENILIDDNGGALLSDFGSARMLNGCKTGMTTGGQFKGTDRYKAPELYQQDDSPVKLTTSSDVYAFGSLLLHTFSGRPPFYKLESTRKIQNLVTTRQTPPRSDYVPALDKTATLWGLMEKCWSFEPSDRPTMQEVLALLTEEDYIQPGSDCLKLRP